jgi:hypothetical protein
MKSPTPLYTPDAAYYSNQQLKMCLLILGSIKPLSRVQKKRKSSHETLHVQSQYTKVCKLLSDGMIIPASPVEYKLAINQLL